MRYLAGGLCALMLGGCHASDPSQETAAACPTGKPQPAAMRYLGSADDNKSLLGTAMRHDEHMLVPSRAANIVIERRDPATSAAIEYDGGSRQLQFNGSRALLNVMIVSNSTFSVKAEARSRCCFRQSFRVDREGVWLLKMNC